MSSPETASAPEEASDPQELKMQPRKLQMSSQQQNSPAPPAEMGTPLVRRVNSSAAAGSTRPVGTAEPEKMPTLARQGSSWEQYKAANKSNPLLTKCITTGACKQAPGRVSPLGQPLSLL